MISSGISATFTLNTDITIRKATVHDLPKLEWYGEYTHFRRVFQRTYNDQKQGQRLMLVADMNQFPVGQLFILLNMRRSRTGIRRAYFYSLRVMEHLRGMGLGTHLLTFGEQLMQQHGFGSVIISAAKDNEGARRLYERLGYAVYAEDSGQWTYENHLGQTIQMNEPCWMLHKKL